MFFFFSKVHALFLARHACALFIFPKAPETAGSLNCRYLSRSREVGAIDRKPAYGWNYSSSSFFIFTDSQNIPRRFLIYSRCFPRCLAIYCPVRRVPEEN